MYTQPQPIYYQQIEVYTQEALLPATYT